MTKRNKRYYCNCVGFSRADAHRPGGLVDMIANGREITRATFLRHLAPGECNAMELEFGYGHWLRMASDPCVSYYKGKLNGKEVVWVRHSSIEYIYK